MANDRAVRAPDAALDTQRTRMRQGPDEGIAMRRADRARLAMALDASREATLSAFEAFDKALDGGAVPQRTELNPPLWELGHIGWFQEFWIARNPERWRGKDADPHARRLHGVRAESDDLYDSSRVPHAARWSLPLPGADATRDDLRRQMERTQSLLQEAAGDDAGLYFFRLALFHEDMHHEAALYMAHALGISHPAVRLVRRALEDPGEPLELAAGQWSPGLGETGEGFAFDNEVAGHRIELPGCRIDRQVVRWEEYLPFVEAGGYRDPAWWSDAGRSWLIGQQVSAPRFLKHTCEGWMRWSEGAWSKLDPALPACHLTQYEAQAWCNWAGRRLPGESEWERAAIEGGDSFRWGDVWEWTASPFLPYPGFVPHPYRDYSLPWFDGRPVLRGASFATPARLRHPRFRNYFKAERNDIFAGFRSCEKHEPRRLWD